MLNILKHLFLMVKPKIGSKWCAIGFNDDPFETLHPDNIVEILDTKGGWVKYVFGSSVLSCSIVSFLFSYEKYNA